MIGPTIGLYFARRFFRAILGIFVLTMVIVFLFDFLELYRRAADRPMVSVGALMAISLLRVPNLCEQVLPFATLFGAMAGFLGLSRNLELVVVRAAGVSVWQFLVPPIAVAALLGVFATTLYNPIAASMKDWSDDMGLALSSRGGSVNDADKAVWFRQDGSDGESVVRAASRSDRGQRLAGVTVLQYDRTGHFSARIEAESAVFTPGGWTLANGRIDRVGAASETFQTRRLPSSLTIEQVRDNLASPDTVPFWSLPRLVDSARNAGIPAFRYQLQYHVLLARPLLLCAMVVVAALVSLRVFRFGNIGALILSGVLAGFVLYVVNEISRDVGGAGLVAPPVAAWIPGVVASLMGLTVLLYQEDG
jgi:lipopolysaccharide export system permease protein